MYQKGKRNVRPKNEMQIKNISVPFDFKHDLHIGQEEYQQKLVDTEGRPISPPRPYHGSSSSSGDIPLLSADISQILKEDIMPVLRLEIGSIVQENIRKILNEVSEKNNNRHCRSCLCAEKEVICLNNDDSKAFSEDNEIINFDAGKRVIRLNDIQYKDGEKRSFRSISNPFYRQKTHNYLEEAQHRAMLVKYGSDLQLAHTESSTEGSSSVFLRSKTLPASANRIYSLKPNEIRNQNGRPLSKADERECLAHALQWNIEEIVEGIVFRDSELPDDLLAGSCLTEDECAGLRRTPGGKNQVRVLLSIIKGRDFDILERFLKYLKSQNEDVFSRIVEKFEQNKKDGMRCSKCALCNLSSDVNLKYVADHLWKHDLIDIGLYNWIVQTDRPAGAQSDLWDDVIISLNKHCVQSPSSVRRILGNALKKNNHYHLLAQGIEWMINTNGQLLCRCELRHNLIPAGSFLSLQSSRSPQSSESELVTDSQSDVSRVTNATTDNTNIKEAAREIKPQAVKEFWKHKVPVKEHDRVNPKSVYSVPEGANLRDDILSNRSTSPQTAWNYGLERYGLRDEISSGESHFIMMNSEFENISLNQDSLFDENKSRMTPSPCPQTRLQDVNSPEKEVTSLTTQQSEFEETKQENIVSYEPPTILNRPIVVLLMDKWEASDV